MKLGYDDQEEVINVLEELIYLVDLPLPVFLPELNSDLEASLRMPVLPGQRHCLQRFVPSSCRPFMGPNLYITPPGAFTWFHEDGHGTVDSGHQCLAGRNEVVMLRRMDEAHKAAALRMLRWRGPTARFPTPSPC
jgi:hypothetical protein